MPSYTSTSLSVAIAQYQQYLRDSRKSDSYVRSVGVTMRQVQTITGDKKVHNVNPDDLSRWKNSLAHCTDKTLNVKLVHARGFCGWARDMRVAPANWNPMAGHRAVTNPRAEAEALRVPRADWPALLDFGPTPVSRALTACGLYALTRSSELVRTVGGSRPPTFASLTEDSSFLTIWRTKTKEWDNLPVAIELSTELEAYFDWYRDAIGAPRKNWYLFPTSRWRSGGMVRNSQGRLLDGERVYDPTTPLTKATYAHNALVAAGFDGHHIGFHTFRRSGARALYDELRDTGRDGSLRVVQTLLGHKSIEMTEVYIGVHLDREIRDRLIAGRFMYGDSATKNEVRHLSDYRHRKNDDDDGQAPVGAVVR
jgi:Phage integrase family